MRTARVLRASAREANLMIGDSVWEAAPVGDGEAARAAAQERRLRLGEGRIGQAIGRARAICTRPGPAVAFALVCVAVGLALRLASNDPSPRFVILYPTVAVAALVGGPLAGVVATAAASFAVEFLFFEPRWSFGVADPTDLLSLFNFAATGILISLISAVDQAIAARMLRSAREGEQAKSDHRTTIEALRQGILVLSPEGELLSANPAAERITGQSLAEMREAYRCFADWPLLGEDGTPMPFDDYPVPRALRGEAPDVETVLGWRRGDDILWIQAIAVPIREAGSDRILSVLVSFYDITERRRREREIAESRARFASIVENAMDAIVSVDADQRIVLFNAAAEQLFGLTAAEAIGRRLTDFVPERHHDAHDRGFAHFARGDETARHIGGVSHARRIDGSEFPIEASVSRVEVDGRPLFTVILRDVSERAAAERVNAQLATVVRHSPDAILTVTNGGLIGTWNEAAHRMFGYSPEEAIGASIGLISFPDKAQDGVSIYRRVLAGESVRVETSRRRADGTSIEVMSSAGPIRDASGEVIGGVAILSDITERRRKERLLAERDEELRQTLDAAGLGVWWVDVGSGLIHGDPRSRRLFAATGNGPAECVAEVAARFAEEDRTAFVALLQDAEGAHPGHPLVARITAPDGTLAFLSLTARARRTPDGAAEIWGTVEDVTEEKRAEEALRRFEASRRLEALGRMTGGIAHDLNNLLTVVSGNLQLLEMMPGSPESGRWVSEALKASESGAALNNRLLTFARRRRLAPCPTDLNELVAGMADMVRRTVGPNIVVTAALTPEVCRSVIDPSEIENGLINLALNARDAMPDGGRIVIETARVTVDETTVPPEDGVSIGEHVRLSVTDTGHGMSADVKAHAFEPFFTTKAQSSGSGLGLATLHGFVRQSGGFVTLYSEPGRGTSVNVYLPIAEADHRPDRDTTKLAPVRGDGQMILVVEDDPAVRRVTEERLATIGYRVEAVADAAAALARVRDVGRRSIDLVLTDVVMPGGMTGIELARALRIADPDRRVLVVSGFAGDFVGGREGPEAEFPFLRKPHSLTELARAIAETLAGTAGVTRH